MNLKKILDSDNKGNLESYYIEGLDITVLVDKTTRTVLNWVYGEDITEDFFNPTKSLQDICANLGKLQKQEGFNQLQTLICDDGEIVGYIQRELVGTNEPCVIRFSAPGDYIVSEKTNYRYDIYSVKIFGFPYVIIWSADLLTPVDIIPDQTETPYYDFCTDSIEYFESKVGVKKLEPLFSPDTFIDIPKVNDKKFDTLEEAVDFLYENIITEE